MEKEWIDRTVEKVSKSVFLISWTLALWPSQMPRLCESGDGFLYSDDAFVHLLSVNTLENNVYRSPKAHLVEFFASWCGHCINFAPKWIQLARETRGWRNYVVVAAFDCSKEENERTCKKYEITSYPTVRYFPPFYPQFVKSPNEQSILNTGEDLGRIIGNLEVNDLKGILMEMVTIAFPNLLQKSPEYPPPFLLENIYVLEAERRWKNGQDTDIVCVVFEDEESSIAIEAALSFSLHPSVQVVSFHRKNPFYHHKLWPLAYITKWDGSMLTLNLDANNPTNYINSNIAALLDVKQEYEPSCSSQTEPKKSHKFSIIKKDFLSKEDVNNALQNILHEIDNAGNLFGRKIRDLRALMFLLRDYFPERSDQLQNYLHGLMIFLHRKKYIHEADFSTKRISLEAAHRPSELEASSWVGCAPSKPGLRGYTCGLWRLFHALTVSAFHKKRKAPVIRGIYGFVRSFFKCDECSRHFSQMVRRDAALKLKTTREQLLWLWRVHNEVNVRLQAEPSEDPEFPKRLYPTHSECPECFQASSPFHTEHVVHYLEAIYSAPIKYGDIDKSWIRESSSAI